MLTLGERGDAVGGGARPAAHHDGDDGDVFAGAHLRGASGQRLLRRGVLLDQRIGGEAELLILLGHLGAVLARQGELVVEAPLVVAELRCGLIAAERALTEGALDAAGLSEAAIAHRHERRRRAIHLLRRFADVAIDRIGERPLIGGLLPARVEISGSTSGDQTGAGADRGALADVAMRCGGGEGAQRGAAQSAEQRALRHLLQVEGFRLGESDMLAAAGIRGIGTAREHSAAALAGGRAGDDETAAQRQAERQAHSAMMGRGHAPLPPMFVRPTMASPDRPGNGIRLREKAAPAGGAVLASGRL